MADILGTATPYGGELTSDDKTWGMLSHLLALLLGFIGPLIVMLAKKDSDFAQEHAKESLNFQITLFLAYMVAVALSCLFIGFILLPIILIAHFVWCIMGTIKANEGNSYRYPLALRLIK